MNVICPVANPVFSVTNTTRLSQKKDVSPSLKSKKKIKCVKSASIVGHCVSVPTVANVPIVAHVQLVGGRMADLVSPGCKSEGSLNLEGRLCAPFQTQTSSSSGSLDHQSANPLRNLYPKEALHALIHKQAVDMVKVQTPLVFFNRPFIVPKPNQKCRPIPDLSALTKFLALKTFKIETPEKIRISLQEGEWVTAGFQRCLFPHPHTQKVAEIPEIQFPSTNLSVQGTSLWPINSSHGVHLHGQGSQVDPSVSGYKDQQVPG